MLHRSILTLTPWQRQDRLQPSILVIAQADVSTVRTSGVARDAQAEPGSAGFPAAGGFQAINGSKTHSNSLAGIPGP